MFKTLQRVTYQAGDIVKAKQWYRTVLGPEDIARQYLTLPDGSSAGKTLSFFSFVRASVLG